MTAPQATNYHNTVMFMELVIEDTIIRIPRDGDLHRGLLCCDFFRRKSDIGTTSNYRLVLPNHDPREWRIITRILDPLDPLSITKKNAKMARPWFVDLGYQRGVEACDKALMSFEESYDSLSSNQDCQKSILEFLDPRSMVAFSLALPKQCQTGMKAAMTTSLKSALVRVSDNLSRNETSTNSSCMATTWFHKIRQEILQEVERGHMPSRSFAQILAMVGYFHLVIHCQSNAELLSPNSNCNEFPIWCGKVPMARYFSRNRIWLPGQQMALILAPSPGQCIAWKTLRSGNQPRQYRIQDAENSNTGHWNNHNTQIGRLVGTRSHRGRDSDGPLRIDITLYIKLLVEHKAFVPHYLLEQPSAGGGNHFQLPQETFPYRDYVDNCSQDDLMCLWNCPEQADVDGGTTIDECLPCWEQISHNILTYEKDFIKLEAGYSLD